MRHSKETLEQALKLSQIEKNLAQTGLLNIKEELFDVYDNDVDSIVKLTGIMANLSEAGVIGLDAVSTLLDSVQEKGE